MKKELGSISRDLRFVASARWELKNLSKTLKA
jgi:hypothetical protein